MKSVQIIFSSIGGNTGLVVEHVAEILRSANIETQLDLAYQCDLSSVQTDDFFIFACPTYGHGEWEMDFQDFVNKLESHDFSGKQCAIIGLGDRRYPKESQAAVATLMTDFFTSVQFDIVIEPLAILDYPAEVLETHVNPWAKKLVGLLSEKS